MLLLLLLVFFFVVMAILVITSQMSLFLCKLVGTGTSTVMPSGPALYIVPRENHKKPFVLSQTVLQIFFLIRKIRHSHHRRLGKFRKTQQTQTAPPGVTAATVLACGGAFSVTVVRDCIFESLCTRASELLFLPCTSLD